MKFSIRELLVVVAFFALGCAALKFPSEGWWGVVGTVAICAVFAAVLIAIFERGARRVFAIGFLICSLGYFWIVHTQKTSDGQNWEYFTGLGKLPSTKLLQTLYRAMFPDDNISVPFGSTAPRSHSFMQIGHALVMLALGYFGGHLARYLYERRLREERASSNDTS